MQPRPFPRLVLAALLLAGAVPGLAADGDRPGLDPDRIDQSRFGSKPLDMAYGAFQRGLYKTAFDLAMPRAQKGDKAAQTLVAEIMARGLGQKQDEAAAAKWYQAAAEQDVPEAQFQYAMMLIEGRVVKPDRKAAFALMQAAADAGNALAQFNFAQLLIQRDPGQRGLDEALPYYQRAADSGLPDAEYAMSQLVANGVGGKAADDAAARAWLLRAAKHNYDTAQLDLGTWLINGKGGARDVKGGFLWLKRAAEGGNVAAQNRLAKLYMEGIGTEPDSIFAAAWFILARRAGLNDPVMDDFMNGLTDDEIKAAQARASKLR